MGKNEDKYKKLNRNVSILVSLTLLAMGAIFYVQLQGIFEENKNEKLELLNRQSKIILDLRDNALNFTSQYMDLLAKNSIEEFIRHCNDNDIDPATVDLQSYIQEKELGYRMNDFYVIDTSGKILNTSFKHDLGLNVYSFGEQFESYMRKIFRDGELHIDGFTIESKTHKLRKYAYKPTADGKYMIEFGAYSEEANILRNSVLKGLEDMVDNEENINAIDIIPPAFPDYYSLYNSGLEIDSTESRIIAGLYESSDTSYNNYIDDEIIHYKVFSRPGSKLYNKLMIRVVYDSKHDSVALFSELQKEVLLYSIGLAVMLIVLFINVKKASKIGKE